VGNTAIVELEAVFQEPQEKKGNKRNISFLLKKIMKVWKMWRQDKKTGMKKQTVVQIGRKGGRQSL